jgi:hypothetical protein
MTTADLKLLGNPAYYFRCTQVGTDANGNPVYALGVDTSLGSGGAGTNGATAPASSTQAGAQYNSAPPTYTNGQLASNQADSHGSLKTIVADSNGNAIDATAAVQVYQSHSYQNVNANGTTTIKSGAGTLVRILWNKKGASSNLCTIYDNTSAAGTVIASIDTTSVIPGTSEQCDLAFATGLTIVLATGTAPDLTLVYR